MIGPSTWRGRLRRRTIGGGDPVVRIGAADPVLPANLRGAQDRVDLRVEGLSCLAATTAACVGLVQARSLRIELTPWTAPGPHLSVRVGQVPGLIQHTVRVTRTSLHVELRTRKPTDLAQLLAAVLTAASPASRPPHGAGIADLALLVPDHGRPPLATTVDRLVTADELSDERVRATDRLVATDGVALPPPAAGIHVVQPRPGTIDPAVHHPIGRREYGLPSVTATHVPGGGLALHDSEGGLVRSIGPQGLVDDLDVRALQAYSRIRVQTDVMSEQGVGALRCLSAAGLAITAPNGSLAPAEGVGELSSLWSRPAPEGEDAVEVASVAQRRAAHRDHSRRQSLGADAPTVSLLLCTNRTAHLGSALRGLATLDYPHLQLVLGLHGIDAPADLDRLVEPLRGRMDVVVHPVAAEVPFGAALAQLSARAEGDLLTKVDDDDSYGPQHVWDLVVARGYSGAAIVGKIAEHVYLEESDVTVRRQLPGSERFARTVAGGAMLISQADLQSVGGWRPVLRSVDRALLDRIVRAGGGVYRTHGLGFVYTRRATGHTWNSPADFATDIRSSRPGLVVPGALG